MRYPDAETLVQIYQRTHYIIHRQTEGISNEDSVIQPPVCGNCMNWILGHILTERSIVLRLLGAEPVMTPAELEKYRRESDPVTAVESAIPFDQLLAKFDLSQELIETALNTITPAELAAQAPVNETTDQVGAIITYIHWHETYHTGQFELLRQLAGKDDKII